MKRDREDAREYSVWNRKNSSDEANQYPHPTLNYEYALNYEKEVAIIGGGLGGCMAAWELANAGWKVTLIESGEELLTKSSNQTPGRMGLGFHYADLDTAEKYLRATINFVKKFPGFHIGEDTDASRHLMQGWYLIAKDSLHTSEEIMHTYNSLKDLYIKLVKEDPSNQVFGDPANFFRELAFDEYKDFVNTDRVVKGIETCERLLDWPRFRAFVINELKNHKNIEIKLNSTVKRARREQDCQFSLVCSQFHPSTGRTTVFATTKPYVVNCTWQNSESIDAQVGFSTLKDLDRTNRLKTLVRVKLPEQATLHSPTGLEQSDAEAELLRQLHSIFVLTGPHCMESNMGDGTALMSYAPVTNMACFKDLTLPEAWDRLINGKRDIRDVNILMPNIFRYLNGEPVYVPALLASYLDNTRQKDWDMDKLLLYYYGESIREGVAQYIPRMANAESVSVNFGVVKTYGGVDITSKDSPFHKRDESGVVQRQCGWITNNLNKLLYCYENAKEVLALLNQHFILDINICEASKKHCHGDPSRFFYLRNNGRLRFYTKEMRKERLNNEYTPRRLVFADDNDNEAHTENRRPLKQRSEVTVREKSKAIRPIPLAPTWSQEQGTYDRITENGFLHHPHPLNLHGFFPGHRPDEYHCPLTTNSANDLNIANMPRPNSHKYLDGSRSNLTGNDNENFCFLSERRSQSCPPRSFGLMEHEKFVFGHNNGPVSIQEFSEFQTTFVGGNT